MMLSVTRYPVGNLLLVLCVLIATGCLGQPSDVSSDLVLSCEYDNQTNQYVEAEWLANDITSWEELPNETRERLVDELKRQNQSFNLYKTSLNRNMTRYRNMSDRNKELFIRLIKNQTEGYERPDVEGYRDKIYANGSTISSLTKSDYPYESRYIIYKNSVYVCGGGSLGE